MPAVAMLGSRKGKERAAGACALALIANDDVGVSSNCKLVEFQEAVVVTGERRHPAARAGGSGHCCCGCCCVRGGNALSAYNSENILRLHMAGRWYSAPSHASETVGAQASAAGALRDLAVIAQNCATIASAGGGIPPLIALLSSPSVDLQNFSAVAIRNVSSFAENRGVIASAGWWDSAAAGVAVHDRPRGGSGALCNVFFFFLRMSKTWPRSRWLVVFRISSR